MFEYREVEPTGPMINDADHGPMQLSPTWGRQFVADLGNGRYDVTYVDTFVVDANYNEDGKPARPVVEQRIAHVLCTDPTDPTGTEIPVPVRQAQPGPHPSDVEAHELPGDDATEAHARTWCEVFDPASLRVPEWPPAHLTATEKPS